MERATLFFFTAFLVFANVFVSSLSIYDYLPDKNLILHLTEKNLIKAEKLRDDNGTIYSVNDLTIGSNENDERIYTDELIVKNSLNATNTLYFGYEVEEEERIHYVSVVNKGHKNVVVFETPFTIGFQTTLFGVRILSNNTATLTVLIATNKI